MRFSPFSVTRAAVTAAELPLIYFAANGRLAWIWAIAAAILYLGILVIGATKIGWRFFMHSHLHGPRTGKAIALSFDDGPGAYSEEILEILKLEAVPAAFFAIGKRVLEEPRIVRRWHAEGHLIGNHSFTHSFNFDWKSPGAMARELTETNVAIEAITGLRPRLFRPPYGVTNPSLAKAVRRTQMESVGWSLRSFDTRADNAVALTQRILQQVRGGDVILLHDTMPITAAVLTAVIQGCRQKGFTFVRLDTLLRLNPYV